MFSINPGLAGPLVNERLAELRRSVAASAPRAVRPRRTSLRTRAGWALVSLGLRLVLPRRSVAVFRAAR
jgi:hypothetical protein